MSEPASLQARARGARRSAAFLGSILLVAPSACDTGVDPSDVALEIVVLGGDAQLGPPASTLREPLEVQVREVGDGDAASNVSVEWVVTQGNGAELSQSLSLTDSAGVTSVILTLGEQLGEYRVVASVDGLVGGVPEFTARAVDSPVVEAIDAGPVTAGDAVTIRGRNFSPDPDDNVVAFSGFRARIDAASETALQVRVPDCLPSRTVDVTVALGGARSDPVPLAVLAGSATLDLPVGGDRLLVDPAAMTCVRVPSGAGITYLAVVSSASSVGAAQYDYTLVGLAGASTMVVPPAQLAPMPMPHAPRPVLDAQSEWEYRLREAERQLLPTIRTGGVAAAAPVQVPQLGERRDFNVLNVEDGFDNVTAQVRYVGEHAVIYEDLAGPDGGLTDADYAAFADEFDDVAYPAVARVFGTESDLDANERVVILFTPVVNQLTPRGASGFVGGFFFGLDLLTDRANSNGGEIFYTLVADPAGQFSDARERSQVLAVVPAILAHEFQHMVHFNQRVFLRGAPSTEALWLSEALAQMAEDVVSAEFQRFGNQAKADQFALGNYVRAQRYLAETAGVSLVVTSGPGSIEERGAGWLFVKYLAEHYGGESLLRNLTQTTRTGIDNVLALVGRSWGAQFADWSAALYLDDQAIPIDARLQYPEFDLRRTLDGIRNGFTLSPARPGPVDFTAVGRLRSSSAAFFLLDIPQAEEGVALTLSGLGGGPEESGARLQMRLVRLN